MSSIVEQVKVLYPNMKIVCTPHPKEISVPHPGTTLVGDVPTIELAQNAEIVVGWNSTALLETAMLGAPTIALGACPYKSHQDGGQAAVERLLAACVARQIPSSARDLSPWFFRLGYDV
jgi:hypothetical protein